MLEEPHLPCSHCGNVTWCITKSFISQWQQGGSWGQKPTEGMQISLPSLTAQTEFEARQTCFLTVLMYQCIA
jgi:hypothetical protein